ncbi:hypothetical protein PSH03_002674 [Micromonospora sp. PSH03]|uniref:hypothetical protein n=1 Tax=Micromonospora TaxID=1873 RepID=UPI001B390848|nr:MULTISPECIES: hypothetical protein [Micromonospora]MBQ0989615.1 hypothetical protein [Micromonospora sp. H61]MCG5457562.1 hypothetical protein [Micromonospora salmantinae]
MPPTSPRRRVDRTVIISIWAVPVLVVGQFAMLAIVPVVLALTVSLRHAHLRGLRRWTIALTTAYATPLILWAIGPDRAPSLSKDMHPLFAALIVVAALAAATAFHLCHRRPSRPDGTSSERPHFRAAP